MIILDFETTGLLAANAAPLSQQPHAIEFAAIKIDDYELINNGVCKEIGRLDFIINPKVPISKKITEITGLTSADVIDQPEFSHFYPQLAMLFLGEKYLVAHNASFDVSIMKIELQRLGRLTQFPWPPIQICTVNQTNKIKGFNLKLAALYEHLFAEIAPKGHRAMVDVETLTRCVVELVKTDVIKLKKVKK